MTSDQYGIAPLVYPTSLRRETSGGVAQCPLFSQANWQRANIILSNLSLVAKKVVLIHSFVHLFIYIFCHTGIRSLLQTLTVVSRNVAIEKINMTEHRIVEMVGGTWYHVLRLTIDYNFAFISSFLSPLWRNLTFFFWSIHTFLGFVHHHTSRFEKQRRTCSILQKNAEEECGKKREKLSRKPQYNRIVVKQSDEWTKLYKRT